MIAILKYNAGNITSVENALKRIGAECIITNDKDALQQADKVIFPGVGEANTAMNFLKKDGLDDLIKNLKQPVLGICLGLQLMCEHSEEGNTAGLNIFETSVKKFPATGIVPHMGWNNIENTSSVLFEHSDKMMDYYFVHSFYAETNHQTIATCNYLLPFAAALQKDNFYATQFHPEKSGDAGEIILKNFIKL